MSLDTNAAPLAGEALRVFDVPKDLPENLPESLDFSIESLMDFEMAIHLRDLPLPDGITLLSDPDEVVAHVAAPHGVVARRMVGACRRHAEGGRFITAMAAVAGSVAEELIGWIESHGNKLPQPDSGISIKPISRTASERIIRFAFEYAREHGRKRVSCVTKANIMKFTDGLFLEVFREIATEYPEIEP